MVVHCGLVVHCGQRVVHCGSSCYVSCHVGQYELRWLWVIYGLAVREEERELSQIRTKGMERRVKALNHYLPREWVAGGGGGWVRTVWCIFFYQNFSLPHIHPNNFLQKAYHLCSNKLSLILPCLHRLLVMLVGCFIGPRAYKVNQQCD